MTATTENTTAAQNNAKEAELLAARVANFKRLFNPKMALLLAKRDEIKRMGDNPGLFEGVLGEVEVGKVEKLLDDVKRDILTTLNFLAEYKTPEGGEPVKPLRKKAEYDLFA